MIKLTNEYKAFNPIDTQYSLKPTYHYYYYYCYYQYLSFVDDNHWFGEIRISDVLWVWWLRWLDEKRMTCGLKWWSGEIMMGKVGQQVTTLLDDILLFCSHVYYYSGVPWCLLVTISKTWGHSKTCLMKAAFIFVSCFCATHQFI